MPTVHPASVVEILHFSDVAHIIIPLVYPRKVSLGLGTVLFEESPARFSQLRPMLLFVIPIEKCAGNVSAFTCLTHPIYIVGAFQLNYLDT